MQLHGIKGIHWTQIFPLTGSEVTIGREAGNTIVCDGDSRVSRRHARILSAGSSYTVDDLGSANGTLVNGVQISAPTPLKVGDEIQVGGQTYRLEESPAATAYPPAGAAPQRPREMSRGERAQQPNGGPTDYLSGCAMPRFNLPDASGCVRALIMLAIAFVVVAIIGGLLMLLGSGIGALTHMSSSGGGSSSTTSGGGSSTSSGGDSSGGQQESDNSIRITGVRVLGTRIQVAWENGTKGPVHKIWARVTTVDAAGSVLGKSDEIVIYDGKPVEAGASHADAGTEGFNAPVGGTPISATVVVTRSE